MSSGAECRFTEVEPGRWTYWLQDWPYGDWPEGETYGPFSSYEVAFKHLGDHHSNPGGHSTRCLPEGQHVHEPTKGGWDYEAERERGSGLLWDEARIVCNACGQKLGPA